MKKFFRRFFIILSVSLVLLLGLTAAAAAIFRKPIGNRIIQELNKQLTTDLQVEQVNLSFFRNFPAASAVLKGVVLEDNQGGVLLEAKTIAFRLGLMGLLNSKYKLDAISISQGAISIFIDEKGQANYLIYKTEPSDSTQSSLEENDLSVAFSEAVLDNMELIYVDESTQQTINWILQDARFSGAFSNTTFNLNSEANIESRFVDIGSIRYLPGQKLAYNAIIEMNLKEQVYQFEKVQARLGDNVFNIDGAIEQRPDGPYYDLFVTSEEGSIQGVLQLLPQEYLSTLGDFSSKGNFRFETLIKGQDSKNLNPEISAQLSLDDGSITSPRLTSDLKNVSFQAEYRNGKYRDASSSSLQIEDFTGYFNREFIEMALRIDNFEQPVIDFSLDGAIPLNAVYGLLNNPAISAGSGEIEIKDLRLEGNYEDMIRPNRIANVKTSGSLEFDDASFTMNKEKLILDRGTLSLEDNRLVVNGLKLEGAGSVLELTGSAFNAIPVLFADSLNTQNAELEFQAELVGEQLDIDRLLLATNLKLASSDTSNLDSIQIDSIKMASVQKRAQLTRFLNGTFKTNIRQFNYYKIKGSDFTGLLTFDNNTMEIRGGTNAMKGIIQLDGTMVFEQKPRLEAKISTEGIDMKTFFDQTNNFQQEVLTAKNISGQLNSNMLIYSYWDEKGNFLMDELNLLAEVEINEGELKDFKMMEAFSTFVKVKDLRRIKFTDLKNYLEIRNQQLYIPAMFIQSNALNLTVSGQHSFNNDFAYYLKVNAGQILTERLTKYDPSLQPAKARRNGFFNLHYNIQGNLEDYNFKSAKRRVKTEFERSDYRKQAIQQALNKAFQNARLIEEPTDWQDDNANNTTGDTNVDN
ncbi:MAG: hypothetical protein Sapg2KO_22590 [Saprospiraceae bacterium]